MNNQLNKYLFILFLIFVSCNKDTKVRQDNKTFFDLKSFVNQEVERLKKSDCNIYKEGEVQQESDQASIPSNEVNWDRELEILDNMDINKSSWIDYFKVDTSEIEHEQYGRVRQINYTTTSSKIPVKRLTLLFSLEDNNRPSWIEAEREVKNWIFHTKQKIYYSTGIGLRAEGYQKILWWKEKTFNITTIYNCKHE
ncbi:MAG: hypothetical protein M9958_06740 [Chitinophagales bacterium]|nr:hypothetical protein [Chitinophagales bacterium]